MAVVSVQNLSLRYLTGDIKDIGLKEYVMKKIRGKIIVEEFWANREITFALEKGDMLGIIGKNGAGKSTLLKAVSGVLEPTEGQVRVKGSVAALLELTAGFDGNLTVKENTYLRGALLGYTKRYMDQMYDHIISFAELEEFQDRQFKQLSSGMKSRLAFSIACLVDPDILILDEVLSVGDGQFRQKSENKMREILSHGVTGLFVSHSVPQIRDLCNKILWLDRGKQIYFGDDVRKICDAYEEFLISGKQVQSEEDIEKLAEDFSKRRIESEKQRQEKEARMIKKYLEEQQPSQAVIDTAYSILLQNAPDLLTVNHK